MRTTCLIATALMTIGVAHPATAQRPAGRGGVVGVDVSAPIGELTYEVIFDRGLAKQRTLRVITHFTVSGREPVLLSLPAWTPGAYEISNFARLVSSFQATADGKPLVWDKLDYDTWRIQPNGARAITVSFNFHADTLDNAMSWSRDDFAFFNGTNVFLYPEGRDPAFSATVKIVTDPQWRVVTPMPSASADSGSKERSHGIRASDATTVHTYGSANYHDLVDMPFFIGVFDVDSQLVADKWVRVASYPAGHLAGDARHTFWDQVQRMFPPMIHVFGETPYTNYTNLIVFDSTSSGGSALEHSSSHFGIYTPFIIGNTVLPSITAHEIFHLWNVKRMRPAEMVPYRYDRAQPTPWLWVSEGITDYYADLALVRGGIVDSAGFLGLTNGKIEEVAAAPPVALEDASLSTWIHPDDGTGYIYYPKGSLAGLLLDLYIRDASDNAASLDDVMREVYQKTYKAGRGFTAQDWWGAVSRAAKGKSFADFNTRYIDGRERFPWSTALTIAGLRLNVDSIKEPRIGVLTALDSSGAVRVSEVEEAGAAAAAGVKPGDILIAIGDIAVDDGFGPRFRTRYGKAEGQSIPIKVKRGEATMTLTMTVRMSVRTQQQIVLDANASPKALRIRRGILKGSGSG